MNQSQTVYLRTVYVVACGMYDGDQEHPQHCNTFVFLLCSWQHCWILVAL
jgi:hypothetical protein